MLLSQKKALEIADSYVDKLKENYTLRLVVLFGSFAKEEWTETSDVDLVVVADELSGSIGENYVKLKGRFIEPLGIKTETLKKELEQLNFLLLDAIEYGKILYKDQETYNKARNLFEEVKKRHNLVRTEKGWNYKL